MVRLNNVWTTYPRFTEHNLCIHFTLLKSYLPLPTTGLLIHPVYFHCSVDRLYIQRYNSFALLSFQEYPVIVPSKPRTLTRINEYINNANMTLLWPFIYHSNKLQHKIIIFIILIFLYKLAYHWLKVMQEVTRTRS